MTTFSNPATTDGGLLDFALSYAPLGWRLLPVDGKRPRLKDWTNAASNNLFTIRGWFRDGCNIGVATGEASGIVVLDVDPRNGGDETLQALERDLGPLPPTVKANTGGGGWHFVFRWFPNAKSTSISGIDFLANGKMFVVAPSMHPTTGAIYEWEINPFINSPAELPEAWQKRFSRLQEPAPSISLPVQQGARNEYLASVAGKLRASGEGLQMIQNKLLECNAMECDPPLTHDEVLAIAASISRYAVSGRSLKTQWQEAVFEAPLPPTTKLVLIALSMYADQHGKSCWPTQEDIARKANSTSRTVRKRLCEAEREGWIKRYTRPLQGKPGFNYGYTLQLRPEGVSDLEY